MYRLGVEFEEAVGWEAMCRLVHCMAWEEWLKDLPTGQQEAVRHILDRQ